MVLTLLWIAGVPLLAVFLAAWAFRRAWRAETLAGRATAPAIACAAACALGYVLAFPKLLGALTSSTAGLAFLGLPLEATAIGAATLPLWWALFFLSAYAYAHLRDHGAFAESRWRAAGALIGSAVLIALVVAVMVGLLRFQRCWELAGSPAATADELRGVYASYVRHDRLNNFYAMLLVRVQNSHVLARVAEHPRLPADVFLDLVRYPDPSVSRRAWRNPAVDSTVLRRLADSRDESTRAGLASNVNTPPDILRRLAQVGDVDVDLYANRSLPADAAAPVFHRMAESAHGVGAEYTRASLADQPNAPPDLLLAYCRDSATVVREHAAFNASMPPEGLARLSEDTAAAVRRGVAGNPNISPDLLSKLLNDPDEAVRSMAQSTARRRGS